MSKLFTKLFGEDKGSIVNPKFPWHVTNFTFIDTNAAINYFSTTEANTWSNDWSINWKLGHFLKQFKLKHVSFWKPKWPRGENQQSKNYNPIHLLINKKKLIKEHVGYFKFKSPITLKVSIFQDHLAPLKLVQLVERRKRDSLNKGNTQVVSTRLQLYLTNL